MKPLVACLAVLCSLLTGMAIGQELREQEVSKAFEHYLGPIAKQGNFTGGVLIARRGQILFRRAYGMANYELEVPNSPETRFYIASVSKPFTAAAILQLEEQHRLSLSDPVSKYVPEFRSQPTITLDELLTHTSGIPNINDLPDYGTFACSPHTLEELVAKFASLPLQFQPGSDYRYSNSNYNLLALVIEKVSGEDYGSYIKKHILQPAGMEHSGHDGDAFQLTLHVAEGYEPAGVKGYEKAVHLDWSNKTGNGSLYSTLDDLNRFDRALNNESVLKLATRQKYYKEGRGSRYGWFIRQKNGRRVMSANGRSPGFTAELDRYPDHDVTVIVLSNSYATASQDPIATALASIVFGEKPQEYPDISAAHVDQSILNSYAGEYQYGPDYFVPNARFSLTAGDGFLLLQLGDFRTPLVPKSETKFLERNFLGEVEMRKAEGGNQNELIYNYGGKSFVAHRTGSASAR